MRYLIILLLLANLAYLGWNLSRPVTVTDEPATTAMPSHIQPLVTLDERPSSENAGSAVEPVEPSMPADNLIPDEAKGAIEAVDQLTRAEPPSTGRVAQACNSLGPFADRASMQEALERLADIGVTAIERSPGLVVRDEFWVYLPSMQRDEVLAVVALLDEHGDEDYFVGRNNYISLGAFRDRARAEKRLDYARDLGLDARLEPAYNRNSGWWLEFPDSEAGAAVVSEILGNTRGIGLKRRDCD